MPIMEDKFVINIGRQLGSGGKAVGEAVARRLGIGVYDKQLINLAAEQSGLCPEVFERVDEKESRNLFSTLVAYLRSPFGRMRGARRTTTITAAVRGAWLRPTTSASIRPCWGSTARWISCWSSWSANWV